MAFSEEYPKLKFPAHVTLAKAQAVRADKPDESFAGAVYTAMRTAEEEADHWIAKFQNDSYFFEYDRLAALVNDAHCSIRSHICEAAEEYLLKHNGVIDIWPDSMGETVHHFFAVDRDTDKKVPAGTIVFDFFGDDYVGKLNFLRRKKKDLCIAMSTSTNIPKPSTILQPPPGGNS